MPDSTQLTRARRLTLWTLGVGLPLIVLLFLFADRAADTWVSGLGGVALMRAAHFYTHLGDRTPWEYAVFFGLVYAVLAEWRGLRGGRTVLFVCVAFALATVFGDALKYTFGRARPELLLTHGAYGFTWFAVDGAHHSFPSGHTLRVFSACTALALRFQRLGPLLLGLAVLEAASRVLVLMHYPSDVICGAMVGILAALWADAWLARSWSESA